LWIANNKNKIERHITDSLLTLWELYGDLLWENGKHKKSCFAFILEMHVIMQMSKIASYNNQLLDHLITEFRKKGNKNSTINRKLSCLSKILRKHHRNGMLDRMPDFSKLAENNSRVRYLSIEEEDTLFSALHDINADYKKLAIVLVDSGARIGEALNISWADTHQKTITFWETKSNSPRTIPVTPRVQELLNNMRNQHLSGPFKHIRYYRFLRAWNEAKERCGLGNDKMVVPHILRHTCASRLAQSGVDIKRIQEFLGHKTLQMTMRYAHLSPKHLSLCADALAGYRTSEHSM